jgi:Zn-dependent peptidase ImmA (M78 family)
MTSNGYSPWAELAKLGDVIVGFVELDDGRGWWEPDERVILIDRRLDRVARRCTVAHELEHALAGDSACDGTADDTYFTSMMERRASTRAARKLIGVDDLAEAIAIYNDDDHQVAAHLDVDLRTLDVRRLTLMPDERRLLRRRLGDREGAA